MFKDVFGDIWSTRWNAPHRRPIYVWWKKKKKKEVNLSDTVLHYSWLTDFTEVVTPGGVPLFGASPIKCHYLIFVVTLLFLTFWIQGGTNYPGVMFPPCKTQSLNKAGCIMLAWKIFSFHFTISRSVRGWCSAPLSLFLRFLKRDCWIFSVLSWRLLISTWYNRIPNCFCRPLKSLKNSFD